MHEAESVFCRVAGHAYPLSFYVEFALANYRAPVMQKPLAEAIAAFVAAKDHEREQDLLSKSHLERVKRDLKCLQRHFPGVTVADLTGTRLMEYFETRGAAHKTFNNRRGIVSTFLKFAHLKDWIADNPLTKIPQRRIRRRRGCAATFTASQASELMKHPRTCQTIRLKLLKIGTVIERKLTLVRLHFSSAHPLAAYVAKRREAGFSQEPTAAFGGCYHAPTFTTTFLQVLRRLGLRGPSGQRLR